MPWHATTAEDTETFGEHLFKALPALRHLSVIYLTGEPGAGKTTLARGFLRACGIAGPVRSPTYTLLESYETPTVTILHIDLYRLRDPTELVTLGLREWARTGYVWLVEWPQNGAGHLPPPDLGIELIAHSMVHDIDVVARTPFGETWLQRLEKVEKPTLPT
jgi:tRNA threonylcarbamoyladenosine biosynthesis protein TsaE